MTEEKSIYEDPDYIAYKAALERDGVKGTEPILAKYRVTALLSAQEGDMEELAQLVRRGTVLNDDERNFVADVLEGKIAPKKGRPPLSKLTRQIGLGYYWLVKHDGASLESATHALMALHNKSRSTILDHKKKAEADPLTQDQIKTYEVVSKLGPPEILKFYRDKDLMSE